MIAVIKVKSDDGQNSDSMQNQSENCGWQLWKMCLYWFPYTFYKVIRSGLNFWC